MITIFYGMCGTFKYSTMTQSKEYLGSDHIFSDIKPISDLKKDLFKGQAIVNDLGLATFRLRRLKNFQPSSKDITIERGITDFIHCYNSRPENSLDKLETPEDIKSIVCQELEYIEDWHKGPIEKVLMIMKDRDFIQNTILLEPHRLETYKDIDNYLKLQDDYVDFTMKFNNVTKVINIPDAQSYIKMHLSH